MPRPTFCYVILAHQYSGTITLVRRIRELSPSATVIVRFEDTTHFDSAALRDAGAIPLVSTIRARWGAWTLTEAMLEALGNARRLADADYLVMISGQDYPVRDLPTWEAEIADTGADALLDVLADHPEDWRFRWRMVEIPAPAHPGAYRALRHAAWRIGTLTRGVLKILPRFADGDRRWLIGVLRLRVRVPGQVRITKCSQWMTLSARAVDAVLRRDERDPAVRAFFRTVRISDESYIQSLLHDDPSLRIWHGQTTLKRFAAGKSSPQWLDVGTLRELTARSPAPFARKVEPQADDVRAAATELAAADLCARTEIASPVPVAPQRR